MLSIARRPSANAAKATERIRQGHEQDDLLHLANRTQLRRVTLTSPAISTPTLATGTSGSQTPPGPPSVMTTADAGANGLMWNTMPDVGERRDRGDVDGNSPRPHVNAGYNSSTNTSISPADAFRAGPSRPDAGNGSRETQQRRAFRALPRSRNLRAGQDTAGPSEHAQPTYQQTGNTRDPHQPSRAMHPELANGEQRSPEDASTYNTHDYQRSNVLGRIAIPADADTRGRSRGVLPFEHMNAFGMPIGMDPSNLNVGSRHHSQSGSMFPAAHDPVDYHRIANLDVAPGMSTHHRGFAYPNGSAHHPAEMMPSSSRQTDTLLYEQPPIHSNTAYDTHTTGDRSARGFHSLADPTTYRNHTDFTAPVLSMDMDMRLRAMGEMNALGEMHSLDTIDMEMGGMDMDNMPLLPAGGSLHDVEQFIAGWHDQ